jgi:hypothetical protein
MKKTPIYLRRGTMRLPQVEAKCVRGSARGIVQERQIAALAAIWDGEPRCASTEHDSLYDRM